MNKKRFVKGIVLIIFSIFIISCGNSSKDTSESTESNSNENVEGTSTENLTKKERYIEKLEDIETGIEKLGEGTEGTTSEKIMIAKEKLKMWTNALKEISEELEYELSEEDYSKFNEEETKWADELNNKEINEEDVNSINEKVEATKSRCYEIVEKYFQ